MKKKLAACLIGAVMMAAMPVTTVFAEEEENPFAEILEGVDVAEAKIGISIFDYSNDFMNLYKDEMVRYLTEDLGFSQENIRMEDAQNKQSKQYKQIGSFIEDEVDVLILNLVESSAAPEVTDLCVEADVPVVYVNRPPHELEVDRWQKEGYKATYVGADARQSGTFQGELILDTPTGGDINGDGVISYIMIQGDEENSDTYYRSKFSVKALTDAGLTTEELMSQTANWSQESAKQLVHDALAQFGKDIEVVFCNNDAMALGALEALQSAGRVVNEDVYLVGVDALEAVLQQMTEGNITGTVFNDYKLQAQTAVNLALSYLKGEEVKAENLIDYEKVTSENAEEVLGRLTK